MVKTKARSSSSSSSSTPSINTPADRLAHDSGTRHRIHSTTGSSIGGSNNNITDGRHPYFDTGDENGDLSDGQLSDDAVDVKVHTGMSSSVVSDHRSTCSPGAPTPPSHNNEAAGFPGNLSTKGIQIRSEKPLVMVLEGHHPQSDQTYVLYKCSLCGFAFPCLEPILAHMQSMHSNQSSFTCDKCGATFKWRSELQLHEQLHKAMDQQQQQASSPFPSIPSSSPPAVKQHGTGTGGGGGPLLMPSFLPPNLLLFNPFFDKLPPDANNTSVNKGSSINNNGNNNSSLVPNKNTLNSCGIINNNNISSSGNGNSLNNARKSSSSSSSSGSSSHVNGQQDTFSEQVLNLSKAASGERNPKSEMERKGRFDHHHHHNHHHAASSPKRKHHSDGSRRDVKIEERMSLMDESLHQQQQSHQQQPQHHNPHHALQMIPKVPSPLGEIEETSPGQFKCRYCDKTFDRIFSVHRHERVHTGYKPCICKVCGRGFSEKRNLRHHIIRFHSDGSGRELLKRARKDKSLAATTKQLAASVLKQASAGFLSDQADSPTARSEPGTRHQQSHRNHHHAHVDSDLVPRMRYNSSSPAFSESRERNDRSSPLTQDDECTNGKMLPDDDRSDDSAAGHAGESPSPAEREPGTAQSPPPSSSRRRKGKPSKKILVNSHSTENSEAEDEEDNGGDESALHVVEDEDGDEETGFGQRAEDCESDPRFDRGMSNKRRRHEEEDYEEDEEMDEEDEEKKDEEDGEDGRQVGRDGSGSDSGEGNGSENSLEGAISSSGGRVRSHGAFFSSYSPRLE